jgi:hypothetical protein
VPLPVPPNTVRCNIVWSLPQGEIAVNTLHFKHLHQASNSLDWAGDMTQRYANLVRDAIKTKWGTIGGFITADCAIQRVDAYHLGEDGLTIDKKTAVATGTNTMVGSGTGQSMPHEVAIVVSLYGYDPTSYDPQGARKRGRIYLPAHSTSIINGGRNANYSVMADTWRDVFNYLQNRVMDNNAAPFQERAQLVVLSKRFTETHPVTHVRVDDIFDVQTRRQNKWIPAVAVRPLTPQA